MAGVVDEIKERISIVDVVGARVSLRKSGRSFKALCPFHSEKTPSFYVFPESGVFKCFGCGAAGDIFTFLMRSDNMDFSEALKTLGEQAGVNLRPAPEAIAEDQERAHLRDVLSAAAAYYHNLLVRSSAAENARAYLAKRGMTQATIEGWQIGYALESWDAVQTYLRGRGYAVSDLAAAGLVIERDTGGYYDRFRNRIMFPIHDIKGNITGFGARALGDDKPKYLNSPQSILFDKSGTLYGIEHAKDGIRQTGQAVIVEGYMDVLIPHQVGITNIVASLGTALTPRHMDQVKRLAKTLILALDADAAGDEATLRGLEVARDVIDREAVPVPTWRGLIRFDHVLETELRVLSLPRGKDPDEVVLEDAQAWQRLVAEALPVVDFYFKAITARLDLRNPRDKAAAVERLLPIIGEVQNDVMRSHYLQKLAALVQVDERSLSNRLRAGPQAAARKKSPDEPPPAVRKPRVRASLEDYCLAILLYEPAIYWKTLDLAISPDDFGDIESRQIYTAFQSFMQSNSAFDLAAYRDLLDASLHNYLDELVHLSAQKPLANGTNLEQLLAKTVARHREQRLNADIARMRFMLGEAKKEADQDEIQNLTRKVHALSEELDRIQKQINELTVLWRTRGEN
jgi:DNA primase